MPARTARRPGLRTLSHRIGDHATFVESMLAGLGRWPVVRPAREVGSWLVTSDHLPDPERLVRVLSSSNDLLIADVWSRFATDDQNALLAGGDVTPLIVDGLNSIVRGASIHAPERFAGRRLDPVILELLAADQLSDTEGQQLNRLLLEVALGPHITQIRTIRPLDRLTTRDPSDFSIALLDAWAVVGDIVTFYQERLVDEAYLRTATERRSVVELGRLVGYEPRPGVAAGVHLAFTLQDGHDVEIPAGTLAKSTPPPGGLPQPFETSEPLEARSAWNELVARRDRPQVITMQNVETIDRILVAGTSSGLRPNDVLLFAFGNAPDHQFLRTVRSVEPDEAADRTEVRLQHESVVIDRRRLLRVIEAHRDLDRFEVNPGAMTTEVFALLDEFVPRLHASGEPELLEARNDLLVQLEDLHTAAEDGNFGRLEPWLAHLIDAIGRSTVRTAAPPSERREARSGTTDEGTVSPLDALHATGVLTELRRAVTVQPANRARLRVDIADQFGETGDLRPRLLAALQPAYRSGLYQALGGAAVSRPSPVEVVAFRVRAPLYGHNAPQRPYLIDPEDGSVTLAGDPRPHERTDTVDLAAPFDAILPGSWVVVRPFDLATRNDDVLADTDGALVRAARAPAARTSSDVVFARAAGVDPTLARADYGIASPITRLRLGRPSDPSTPQHWFEEASYGLLRGTHVLAQAEPLQLAMEPIEVDVAGAEIELDRLHDGLEPGRWVIVAGERAIDGVDGVEAAELAMIAGVEHRADPERPGEQLHTYLRLAGTAADGTPGLSYAYRRPTVRIYGNVVTATNGESNRQVLGSGDGRAANQRFELRGSPLTHVSAPTPAGATPELEVRVNGVRWHPAGNMIGLGPDEPAYLVRTDDDVTSVVFGDGVEGARLPSGAENVEASYRLGLGLAGNVDARTIDTLIDRPLGVRAVVNPIRASGGADREDVDRARDNAPKAVLALDRLVAVRDYADFASTFAGVVKADARLLASDGGRLVHLTVALAGAAPLDLNSDLYRNLREALATFGDPRLSVRIEGPNAKLVALSAGVRIDANHRWEDVEPRIRNAISNTFGFDARPLGRGLPASELIAVIDGVLGVDHVDLDVFEAVDEERLLGAVDGDRDERHAAARPRVPANRSAGGSRPRPNERLVARPAHVSSDGVIVASDLLYADPSIREIVVLQEILR